MMSIEYDIVRRNSFLKKKYSRWKFKLKILKDHFFVVSHSNVSIHLLYYASFRHTSVSVPTSTQAKRSDVLTRQQVRPLQHGPAVDGPTEAKRNTILILVLSAFAATLNPSLQPLLSPFSPYRKKTRNGQPLPGAKQSDFLFLLLFLKQSRRNQFST
jgi:hypothetical protein